MPDSIPRPDDAEPLLVSLAGVGHEVRRDASYVHDAARRTGKPTVVLQLTLRGCGFYEDDTGRTELPSGWAFCATIPGAFRYGYPPGVGEPYELAFVNLAGPVASSWHEGLIGDHGSAVLDLADAADDVAATLTDLSRRHADGTLPDRYHVSATLYAMLMTVSSELTRGRLDASPAVKRALTLLSARFADPSLRIGDVAAAVGMSREHLSRLCHATTGRTPADHLADLRLRHAARLLRESDAKLDVIARRCGFAGANYLCRLFGRRLGVTPAEFRRRPWMTV